MAVSRARSPRALVLLLLTGIALVVAVSAAQADRGAAGKDWYWSEELANSVFEAGPGYAVSWPEKKWLPYRPVIVHSARCRGIGPSIPSNYPDVDLFKRFRCGIVLDLFNAPKIVQLRTQCQQVRADLQAAIAAGNQQLREQKRRELKTVESRLAQAGAHPPTVSIIRELAVTGRKTFVINPGGFVPPIIEEPVAKGCSGPAPKPAPKPPPTTTTTTATGPTVPFYRAYVLYPGSIFDNPVSRSYPNAQGSVTVIHGSCLVRVTGLHAGAQYNVFIDTNAVPNASASAILSGPWQQLGTFAASSGGVGTYTCTQQPPKGSILDINAEPQDLAILFSGQIP